MAVEFDLWSRKLLARIDQLAPVLVDLSHRIHANPELGHEERKAAAWCTELLRSHGFEVTKPVAGLETAFRATYEIGHGGAGARPAIAFLAEYDALPGIGHACGHNIIAASAVGAGIALAETLAGDARNGDACCPGGPPRSATIFVDGTPAEETTGGKIAMVAAGLYSDVAAAISMHPETYSGAGSTCLGTRRLTFSYHGRAAHAAAEPDKGINALDAAIQTFTAVNALRQHVRPDVRIHGIITHGGEAPNIVPAFSQTVFEARSVDVEYHRDVLEKVRDCARAAALATGATLQIKEDETFEPTRRNAPLTRLALEAMELLGLLARDMSDECFSASTDFGNVSQVCPAIAPMIRTGTPGMSLHHADFAAAAGSPDGDAAVIAAAKVMSLVAARLILEPEKLAEARAAFA